MVVASMVKPPPEDIQLTLFVDQLRGCNAMKDELFHFDRADEDSPQHTLEFLHRAIERYLGRLRHARNRKAIERALRGGAPAAPAAKPAAPAMGGKSKGRGRSPSKGSDGKKGKRGARTLPAHRVALEPSAMTSSGPESATAPTANTLT